MPHINHRIDLYCLMSFKGSGGPLLHFQVIEIQNMGHAHLHFVSYIFLKTQRIIEQKYSTKCTDSVKTRSIGLIVFNLP